MSGSTCLGQPPLPPKKFSRVPILQSFLKSTEQKNQPRILRRYSLRKKRPDRFSCTYQSFGKDLYEGGEVVLRDAEDNSRFTGKFPYSDFSDSTTSLSRSRPNSVNSILTLSRSHSDGNLSTISDDGSIFRTTIANENFSTFANTSAPCASINTNFTKYIRVLSGSWKNLLNRKSCIL